MKRLALVSLLSLFASSAIAQTGNPYVDDGYFHPECIQSPYVPPFPGPQCTVSDLVQGYGARFAIGEGIIGDAGHELGYIAITNMEQAAQRVLIRIKVEGQPMLAREFVLGPEATIDLRSDPAFASGRKIFKTFVYSQQAVFVSLKVYQYGQAEISAGQHPLAHATIDKDGVLIPRVGSPDVIGMQTSR